MQSSDYPCHPHPRRDISDPRSHDRVFALWTFSQCVAAAERDVAVGFAQLSSSAASGLPDNIRLRLRCGARSWHSSLTNSNSQQSNVPRHNEQPQADPCDSDYTVSDKQILCPSVRSFLPMSHFDMTVPPFSNPACSVHVSGQSVTIVLSHGFAKRSLRGARRK